MKILTFPAAVLAAVAILTAATGNRQVTQNAKSPSAETAMTLGGKHVTIEYNAPSARGRQVEGGLIPYTEIYRLGADAATTLTTEADITIGDLKVPAGVHTLYLQAKEGGPWLLAVNNQTKQWGTMYDMGQDLGRNGDEAHQARLSGGNLQDRSDSARLGWRTRGRMGPHESHRTHQTLKRLPVIVGLCLSLRSLGSSSPRTKRSACTCGGIAFRNMDDRGGRNELGGYAHTTFTPY